MNSIRGSIALLALGLTALLYALPAFGQTSPNEPFHDQNIGVSLQYDQSATTPVTGAVFYSKLTNPSLGIYSYTLIRETSVTLKPRVEMQTQTETGFCVYTLKFGTFDVFTCGSGGLSAAGDSKGASGTGSLLITKALKNGWSVGVTGGPSYSGAIGKVTYPVGIVFGWGK